MFAADGGDDTGEASHITCCSNCVETLGVHPGVTEARGVPDGQFTRVQATLDPTVFGGTTRSGSFTIRWFAGEAPTD